MTDHPLWQAIDRTRTLCEGGRISNTSPARKCEYKARGDTYVRFHPMPEWKLADPAYADRVSEREQLCLAIADMEPTPKKSRRTKGLTVEQVGTGVLVDPDHDATIPWVARIYYRGECGDLLAAEFGGLTRAHAREIASTYARYNGVGTLRVSGGYDAEAFPVRRPLVLCYGPCRLATGGMLRKKSDPERQGCACGGTGKMPEPWPGLRHEARLVTWPSETHRPIRFVVDVLDEAA